MIEVKCDRCRQPMDPKGNIGYLSWCFKDGIDGDLEMNLLEGKCFCEHCMDRVMYLVSNPQEDEAIDEFILKGTTRKLDKQIERDLGYPLRKKRKQTEANGSQRKKKPRITCGNEIRELKRAGLSTKEIAECLDLKPHQVQNWLYNHREGKK